MVERLSALGSDTGAVLGQDGDWTQAGKVRVRATSRRQGLPLRETRFGVKVGEVLRISVDRGRCSHPHHPQMRKATL